MNYTFGQDVLDVDGRVPAGGVVPRGDAEAEAARPLRQRDAHHPPDLARVVRLHRRRHLRTGGRRGVGGGGARGALFGRAATAVMFIAVAAVAAAKKPN